VLDVTTILGEWDECGSWALPLKVAQPGQQVGRRYVPDEGGVGVLVVLEPGDVDEHPD
jgi:hypothetical protein